MRLTQVKVEQYIKNMIQECVSSIYIYFTNDKKEL